MNDDIELFAGEYRWLSNFWPAQVYYDDREYRTVEHAYQAAKTTNEEQRDEIRCARDPGVAKRLGRKVDMRPDWDTIKLHVMEDLVEQKFNDPRLRQLLLATGERKIVEGNYWKDYFWGVCNGRGENHLGRIIMKVRAGLLL